MTGKSLQIEPGGEIDDGKVNHVQIININDL